MRYEVLFCRLDRRIQVALAVVYRRGGAVRCGVRLAGFAGLGARHAAYESFGRGFPSLLLCGSKSVLCFRRRSVSVARRLVFRLPICALSGAMVPLSRFSRLWEGGGRSRRKPMAVVVCEVRLGHRCDCRVLPMCLHCCDIIIIIFLGVAFL